MVLAIALLPLIAVSVAALLVVPNFIPVYASFGASLPISTKLLLVTYQWWLATLVLPLALWFFLPEQNTRAPASVIAGVAIAALLFIFGVWSLYAPIFQLGDTVGG